MNSEGLANATTRMRAHGIDERAIAVFAHYYAQLEAGSTGYIPEDSIAPLSEVTELADLGEEGAPDALAHTVVVKLNGGLGTSMGLQGPKTALVVRDGLTFLDVMARQNLALRAAHGVDVPFLLMNSLRTRDESLARLARYADLAVDSLPLDFMQSAEPKLRADDLMPVDWPADPELEWCPPGHGDVYLSLSTSGILEALLARGCRHLFLSNSDNLGATCDPRIPAWMAREGIPYVAEVCERTPNDRKGGHLAVRRSDGRIVLRDSAAVRPGEEHWFADENRHHLFHANNLWVDLSVLAGRLAERSGVLGLPIIVNRKTVDPTDPASTPIIQIETAMGAAVELFDGARALKVPRTRFRPVKTTNELLLLRSDRFAIDELSHVVSVTQTPDTVIDLDGHYRMVADFDARLPFGAPSLRDCARLTVSGDVTFGRGVTCLGDVTVQAEEGRPRRIADGSMLTGVLP
ncbi:MAG: UTP--glucose-1-phosphate uridylyltransferase [Nostocoides sp.]